MSRATSAFARWTGASVLVAVTGVTIGADETRRDRRSLELEPATVVEVLTSVGDVRIQGSDGADLTLEVVRRAPDSSALERLPLAVEQEPGRIRIVVRQQEDGKDPDIRSSVTIRAPRGTVFESVQMFEGSLLVERLTGGITAAVERGSIEARSLAGAIRLETGIGDLRLTDAALSEGGVIRLRTFNGDVHLELARVPDDARILALALDGEITSDIPLELKDSWGPHFGQTTLGRGEPVISIDAVTGDIAIEARQRARDLGARP